MSELSAVEVHEAAHACLSTRALGERPHTVAVMSDNDGVMRSDAYRDQDPQNRMVVLLAGRAAEVAFGFRVDSRDAHDDQRVARGMALRVAGWPGNGDTGLQLAERIYLHAEQRAEQLVRDHRDAIASVAAALRRNGGRLAGVELDRALKAAFARPSVRPAGAAASDVDFAETVLRLHRGRSANWRMLLLGSGRGHRGARSHSILISPMRR